MAHWYPLEPVDERFFTTAPYVYSFPVDLDVTPERVWQALTSDESLAAWRLGVRGLRWLDPRPFGVGTRREVVLPLSAMTIREEFFRWDEGKRYSFFVREANRRVLRLFAEDYVVETTPTGSRFTWTIALTPARWARAPMWLTQWANPLMFGLLPRAARKYFAAHP